MLLTMGPSLSDLLRTLAYTGLSILSLSTTHAQTTVKDAAATTCSTTIAADDAYHFIPNHIDVPQLCQDFTVTLKHTGRLPKAAMGHNWVLTTKADAPGVAKDGLIAGLDNNFVTPGDKRIIASTKVIGSGETTEIRFPVSALKPNETYAFQCSFGGHSALMQGSLRLSQTR